LHNAVMQFKLDKGSGNLSEFLNSQNRLCKAAAPEWAGWAQYQKKYAARVLNIQKAPRLKPVQAGEDDFTLNPGLCMRKNEFSTTINCALLPSLEGVSFADGYAAAHSAYDKADLKKLSTEGVIAFHKLLFMEIQYLASCCTRWRTTTAANAPNGDGGGGSAQVENGGGLGTQSMSILSATSTARSALPIAGSAAAPAASQSADIEKPAPAASHSADIPAAVNTISSSPVNSIGSTDDLLDLNQIVKWDHRSGRFPLTDGALRQMSFPEHPRPRYYFAAGLLLYMRASRTPIEEEVFQTISDRWENAWFSEALDYCVLARGPPTRGAFAYTEEEANWCHVRMQELDKAIKDDSARARLGLPPKKSLRNRSTAAIAKEQEDLLTSEPEVSVSQLKKRGRDAARIAARTRTIPASAAAAAGTQAESQDEEDNDASLHSISSTPRASKARRASGGAKRLCFAATGSAGGMDSPEPATPLPKHGIHGKDGKIVSSRDGRPLTCTNSLRRKFPSNYRCALNTRLWYGHALDLGQAFKLAIWTFYGPRMPTEKSGDLETRKALFRTAAYYAMSMDGSDEQEVLNSPEVADFMFILVSAAKQLRYSLLTEGRVFFGDNVFTALRASKKYQGEFLVCCIVPNYACLRLFMYFCTSYT
jgi:hypothetical protein